jgi:hypothetical protein
VFSALLEIRAYYRAMRSLLCFLVFAASLLTTKPVEAAEVGNGRSFGLGFQLGEPTAFTGKVFLDRGSALDFGIGWHHSDWYRRGLPTAGPPTAGHCWDDRRGVWYDCGDHWHNWSIHLDYLWEDTLAQGSARLDWHIGLGGRMVIWDEAYYYNRYGGHNDYGFIFRVPIGLDLAFRRPDFLEIFFEIAPGMFFVPFADFNMDADIGIRFYF